MAGTMTTRAITGAARAKRSASSNSTTRCEYSPALGALRPVRTDSTNAAAARASGSSDPPGTDSASAKCGIGTTLLVTSAGSVTSYSNRRNARWPKRPS